MKCPDCEMEVDSLVKSTGTCKLCYKRCQNMKYRKIEYVPLKDIKGTNEYNRAMGRRLGTQKRSKTLNKKSSNIIKTNNTNSLDELKQRAKAEVQIDVEHYRKSKDIKPLDISGIQLMQAFDLLHTILVNDIGKQINLNKQIFDMLMLDYFHEVKPNMSLNNLEAYALHGAKEECIQELRTPIVELDGIYRIIDEVFSKFRDNVDFMNAIKKAKTDLDIYLVNHQNPVYLTTTPSMQKYDFVVNKDKDLPRVISKPNRQNKYYAMIRRVRNLYGNPNEQQFNYKPAIYANNMEEAKEIFLDIVQRDFGNMTFKTEDVMITLYSDKEYL